MPFERPTLAELRAQTAADLRVALPGADALLRFSNLWILTQIEAALANGQYGYLDWVAKQAVPFTATDEFLEAWAALKGVTREPATQASGTASFPAANGTVLPGGTPIVRGDGFAYVVVADGVASAGAVVVDIAAAQTGSGGNTQAGTVLTLGSAVAGVASTGAAATNLGGGADVETDASLRARMLQAYAAPPQGGALADYVTWALQVPGVTRAWNAGTSLGAGKVQVYFMMDVTEAAYGGFPQGTNGVAANETRDTAATGDQLLVANHIYPLRPVTALVYAYAPQANPVAFTITGLSGASSALKAQIQAAMDGVFLAQAAPGGVTDANGNPVGVVDLSALEAAIAALNGTAGFVISSVTCPHGTVVPGVAGNITSSTGYLAVRGVITWA